STCIALASYKWMFGNGKNRNKSTQNSGQNGQRLVPAPRSRRQRIGHNRIRVSTMERFSAKSPKKALKSNIWRFRREILEAVPRGFAIILVGHIRINFSNFARSNS